LSGDFDMDKKITRRAVLGTAVAGLAIAPFAVRALRQMRRNELLGLSEAEAGRDVCIDEICRVNGMTRNQVESVMSKFIAEKEMWLKFREVRAGVSCCLRGRELGQSEWLSIKAAGQIRFAANKVGNRQNQEDVFPWDFCLQYFGNEGEEGYTYSVAGSLQEFTGKRIEAVDHRGVLQLFSAPLVFFTQFMLVPDSHVPLVFASGGYQLTSLGTGGEEDDFGSFVMGSDKESGGIGASFKNGLFNGLRGTHMETRQQVVMDIDRYVPAGNMLFPTQFNSDMEGAGENQKQISFTMSLSDVDVTTA
jgi:hypothetical protein